MYQIISIHVSKRISKCHFINYQQIGIIKTDTGMGCLTTYCQYIIPGLPVDVTLCNDFPSIPI